MIRYYICILASLLSLTSSYAQSLKVSVSGEQRLIYGQRFALLIGVSNYDSMSWNPLRSVPEELRALANALRRQGFSVKTVVNPNGAEMSAEIKNFIAYHRRKSDRLLIYYSGHGWTDSDRKLGYLVPKDAPDPTDRNKRSDFLSRAISMVDVTSWSRQIEAKYALFVFDSC